MSCFLFCLFARFELATRGSKCAAFGRNSPGDCFAASALYLCADYSFLPVEQPKCPASFFIYLQDLNLRHEAPNAQHLAETVRGTVSQRVPYISVLDYSFLPVEQPECPASFFCLFARFELATRGSKCIAFGRNSPGDCFAASALYFCDWLSFFSSGAALFLRRCSTYCSTWSCEV